ncbi:hypothetical protein B0H19DRAFT_1269174 [Mycena capillaripes]|nr:hypothetical protein B0H19DRAFT_1269174 [Mycena capillaripes]
MFFSKLAALSVLAFAAFSAAAPTAPSDDNITGVLTHLQSNFAGPITSLASTNANTAHPDIVANIKQLTAHLNSATDQIKGMGGAPIQDISLPELTALLSGIIHIVIGTLTAVLGVAKTVPTLLALVLPPVIEAATALLTLVTLISSIVVGFALTVLVTPVLALLATATALLGSLLSGVY